MDWDNFINKVHNDNNLMFFDTPIKIITIYDHYIYERSDYDSITNSQRNYLEKFLTNFGFKQISGRELKSKELGLSIIYPKPQILGASLFDILRYEKVSKDSIYILSPTQCACYFLSLDDFDMAKKLIEDLIFKFPINLKKMKDHAINEPLINEKLNSIYKSLEHLQQQSEKRAIENAKNPIGKVI